METETINQLKEIFTPVAQKIGETSQFGWEVVVRQQFAYGVIGVFIGVLGIILGYIAYRMIKKADKLDEREDKENEAIFFGVVGIVGGAISIGMIIAGFITGILHLINPHFYAIKFFIGLIGK